MLGRGSPASCPRFPSMEDAVIAALLVVAVMVGLVVNLAALAETGLTPEVIYKWVSTRCIKAPRCSKLLIVVHLLC